MDNFSAIQFPHRFAVVRRVCVDRMCRNCNTSLPVHFVNRAAGRLSPGDRVPDTDSQYVISDGMNLLANENHGAAGPLGKPLTHLRNPGVVMRSHGNHVQSLPPSFHHRIPGRKDAPAQWEAMDVKIRGEDPVAAQHQLRILARSI